MFIGLKGTFAVASREDLARVLGPTIEALQTSVITAKAANDYHFKTGQRE
jgi:hypothetical protein